MERVATDWDEYYKKVPLTARLTRMITRRLLVGVIVRHQLPQFSHIVEPGGANSCFFAALDAAFSPRKYVIIDNNARGLELFRKSHASNHVAECVLGDILNLNAGDEGAADLVFSVGLIEHFDIEGTRRAVEAHFNLARPGGLVLIAFPTPVPIYRATRGVLEWIDLWKFPDERPLAFDEVHAAIAPFGDVLEVRTNRAIALAQGIVVARKHEQN